MQTTSFPGSLLFPPPWSERRETLGPRLACKQRKPKNQRHGDQIIAGSIASYPALSRRSRNIGLSMMGKTGWEGLCRKLRPRKLRPQTPKTPSYHANSDPQKLRPPRITKTRTLSYHENSEPLVSRKLRPPRITKTQTLS